MRSSVFAVDGRSEISPLARRTNTQYTRSRARALKIMHTEKRNPRSLPCVPLYVPRIKCKALGFCFLVSLLLSVSCCVDLLQVKKITLCLRVLPLSCFIYAEGGVKVRRALNVFFFSFFFGGRGESPGCLWFVLSLNLFASGADLVACSSIR